MNKIYFSTIDSTSLYLRNNPYNEDTLVVANYQTNGKGRTGKSFLSPINGIYFSLLTYKKLDELLTIKVAVAIKRVFLNKLNIKVDIKWVNDIYLNNLKLAGILCELVDDHYIIGIGININNDVSSISNIACSLSIDKFDKFAFIDAIINEMYKVFDEDNKSIVKEYENSMFLINKTIRFKYDNKECQGIAKKINDNGNLIVNLNGNEIVLNSGEVSILFK